MQEIIERLKEVPTTPDHITTPEFEFSTNQTGERSVIAEYDTVRPVSIRPDKPFDLSLVAYQTFETDGDGDTDTFPLSHDLIDSNLIKDSLVVYADGQQVEPDSVDFAGNSFDYNDGGAVQTLEVFYAAGDQALVEVEKVAPNDVNETLWSGDIGMIHRREVGKDPLQIQADLSPLSPVVPTDYTLQIVVDAPYTVAYRTDADGDGEDVVADNLMADVPIQGAPAPVDGLDRAVRLDMAER